MNPSGTPPNGSLNRTIRERQKQAVEREATAKRSTIEYLAVPPTPPQPSPSVRPLPLTKPAPTKPSVNYEKVATATLRLVEHKTGWTRRQLSAALIVVGLVSLVISVFLVVGTGQASGAQPTLTFAALPLVSADDALGYMKQVGVAISGAQRLNLPNKVWQAQQGTQFVAQVRGSSGSFLLLSYDSADRAGEDGFRASQDRTYGQWSTVQVSNILLLTAPGNTQAIDKAILAQLNSQLLFPYRPGIITATPMLSDTLTG